MLVIWAPHTENKTVKKQEVNKKPGEHRNLTEGKTDILGEKRQQTGDDNDRKSHTEVYSAVWKL